MTAGKTVMSLLFLILFMFCVDIVAVDIEKKNKLKELLTRKGYSILHQNVRGLLNNFAAVKGVDFVKPKY